MTNNYALILAGGKGTRFWPVSTTSTPKQFIDLMGTGSSLLQGTYRRINKLITKENIFILTNNNYKNLVTSQLPKISNNNILLEPEMRNTAPCILYACFKIHMKNPKANVIIAPSDHWIEDEEYFLEASKYALEIAKSKDILVTMGISPTYANTGYGYIKYDTENDTDLKEKKVLSFKEKPNLATAEKFLFEGNYLWNAGIFIWKTATILKEFQNHSKKLFNLFNKNKSVFNTSKEIQFINKEYHKAENISIDYAILEKSSIIYTIPSYFEWTDLGTWKSLFLKKSKIPEGNVIIGGNAHIRESKGNIIHLYKNKKVIIKGLKNYVVAETKECLMIYPLEDNEELKEIVQNLE